MRLDFFSRIFFFTSLFFLFSLTSNASTYKIQFGGNFGFKYYPDSLTVFVGDTVEWVGNFHDLPLVISGAASIGPIDSGNTFFFVIPLPGKYNFQNPIWGKLGMVGSIRSFFPTKGSITNEGTEFYLGMLVPTYQNSVLNVAPDANVFATASTYYDNIVTVSYFDVSGAEHSSAVFNIAAGTGIQIPLDITSMQMDTTLDAPAYKACHVKSLHPISLTYCSVGASSGGSYLALPVLGLGKKYVAASFNDNLGTGAEIDSSGKRAPKTSPGGAGEFLVIGTEYGTTVTITPATTTNTGHPGFINGISHPFTISLDKGECYLVRSATSSEDNDMSGSIIEASKPVCVISGHENANIGDAQSFNAPYISEERDFLIEEMVPVEFWDSTGYISIPFAANIDAPGDIYRIYAFDNGVKAHIDVQGINGGYDLTAQRLAPSQLLDISAPIEAYSPNGKRIQLMQYSQHDKFGDLHPSPSMMTIVPASRWRTTYSLMFGSDKDKINVLDKPFIAIISPAFNTMTLSIDGKVVPLSTLNHISQFSNLSTDIENLSGRVYTSLSLGSTYRLSSSIPFAVYAYAMRDYCQEPSEVGKSFDEYANFLDQYSSPAGMELNTGVYPSFKVDTQISCTGWHICVRDTGSNDPGIKAVMLIDDPDGIYFPSGGEFSNVSFDKNSNDYADGELHPHWHSNGAYCFDINYTSALAAASAPIAIIDNLGNAMVVRLDRSAPTVLLSTNPPAVNPDSIVFPVKKIGDQICTTFVIKNTAPTGSTGIYFTSANFTTGDTSFKILSITPILPHSIAPGDSLVIRVCYSSGDSLRHQDSILVKSDCFSLGISLDAHGSTGLISAGDLLFDNTFIGSEECKILLVKNVGSQAFTLTGFSLSDTTNFSIDSASLKKLPLKLSPGAQIGMNICFHPQTKGLLNAGIDWQTDLDAAFKHSVKDHSALSGEGSEQASVSADKGTSGTISIRPNPVNGNNIIIDLNNYRGDMHALPMEIFDVLGREVYASVLSSPESIVPIGNLSEGMYFVFINFGKQRYTSNFTKIK